MKLDYVYKIQLAKTRSIMNTTERTHVFASKFNKHALPISVTQLGEVQILI